MYREARQGISGALDLIAVKGTVGDGDINTNASLAEAKFFNDSCIGIVLKAEAELPAKGGPYVEVPHEQESSTKPLTISHGD